TLVRTRPNDQNSFFGDNLKYDDTPGVTSFVPGPVTITSSPARDSTVQLIDGGDVYLDPGTGASLLFSSGGTFNVLVSNSVAEDPVTWVVTDLRTGRQGASDGSTPEHPVSQSVTA